MKRVLLRAPVLTQSGYGTHGRQIARWLFSKQNVDLTVQILPWGDTPWILDEKSHNGLIGKIIQRSASQSVEKFDVAFQLQLPNEWDTRVANYNVGMSAVVETDRCNPTWIDYCNAVDAVVVPSKHAETVLRETKPVTKPIHVVPESYIDEILDPKPSELQFSTSFNFLVVGQITGTDQADRKNTRMTIKWLCEAFKDDPTVGIVLKTNMGQNTKLDKHNTRMMLEQLLREHRVGPYPKVHLLHGSMTDVEMASLYVHPTIKALVSLTRGEGFGLPILEAAASGLPVIVTNWSGHLDYMNKGKFIQIAYRLDNVHSSRIDSNPPADPAQRAHWETTRIFVPGSRWAEASEEDFKKKIVKFKNSSAIPRQWASELKQKLLVSHSQREIEAHYNRLFEGILC